MIPRTINVIDMYHGNVAPQSSFPTLRDAGVFAVIHKASQGLHYRDPAYAERRKQIEGCGMLFGAYHFLNATDAADQADFFIECSGITANNSAPIMLACDYENSPSQPSLQQVMTFMQRVDSVAPGVQCVLYSGNLIRETLQPHKGGFQHVDMTGAPAFFQQHRLWMAEYGPTERIPYPWNEPIDKPSDQGATMPAPGVWLWQYTEKGRMPGLKGSTDGNFFDGTFEDLQKRWLA